MFKWGQQVWTKKLEAGNIRGSLVKERYGHYSGIEWTSIPLTITRARKVYRCADCGATIDKGELHGGSYYDHYCLDCVMADRPETRFEPRRRA